MGSETRLRIVTEAARLFHEQGFATTSVADVLGAADVHSGSLYHFFSNKVALLEAVLERHRERLGPAVLGPAEVATRDPLGRVFALLGHYRRILVVSDCTRGCPVCRLTLEVGPREARARSLADRYFAEWAGGVLRWLDAAADRLPAGLDRPGLARHVLAVMQGATVQAIAADTLEPFDSSVAELGSYLSLLEAGAGRGGYSRRADAPSAQTHPLFEEVAESVSGDWRSW
jgi:TetR/AcrR family transcriptional repressor of nem operon